MRVKRTAERAAQDGRGPKTALEYSNLMNQSAYLNNFSFTFQSINRGVDVFPKLKPNAMPGIKQFCEMSFEYFDEKGQACFTPGVVMARMVTGTSRQL